MTKQHVIYTYLLIVFSLFFWTSCSKDISVNPVEKEFTLHLQPQMPDVHSRTRATEPGEDAKNENYINYGKLQIFFFDNANGTLLWKPAATDMVVKQAENKIIFSAFEEKSNCMNKTVTTVVLANLSDADIANITAANITSLAELDNIRTETTFNTGTQPSSFVMRGERVETFGANAPTDVKTVDMQRLAVKIRAMYPAFSAKMAAAINGTVEVKLISYVDKSYLSTSHYYADPTGNPVKDTSYGAVASGASRVHYSYGRTYTSPGAKRTFLMYKVPYRLGDGTIKNYYYKVDVSGSEAQNPEGFNRLQANRLYEVKPIINGYGSETEEETDNTASVSADISIIDWTTRTEEVRILDIHYFLIRDTHIVMPNTSSITIPFEADLPVTINPATDIIAKTVTYTSTNSGYLRDNSGYDRLYVWNIPTELDAAKPTVTVNNTNKIITISSTIPVNFVHKKMTLTFHSGDLQETITVIQYPLVYMEGVKSKIHPALNSSTQYNTYNPPSGGQNNATLYTVNAITAAEVYAGSLKVRVGNPASIDAQGRVYTRDDTEANRLVSPKFAIASQIGIYRNNASHNDAVERCRQYAEYDYGPGTWRVPTTAELQLIGKLQSDGNSAVKNLLAGDQYWTAEKHSSGNYYVVTLADQVARYNYTQSPVRCVRDIY